MLPTRFIALVALTVLAATPHAASSQSSHRLSLQGGGFYQRFTGPLESDTDPGFGYEAQVRYASRAWSVGVGVDYVEHGRTYTTFTGSQPPLLVRSSDANFLGAFVEPRLALGDPRRALQPYLMLRAGYSRAKPEVITGSGASERLVEAPVKALTWNGGLGVLVRIIGPLNADVSASGGMIRWKNSDDDAFGNQAFSSDRTSTGNITARVGFSIGLMR